MIDRFLIYTDNNNELKEKIFNYLYKIDNSIIVVGDNSFIQVLIK